MGKKQNVFIRFHEQFWFLIKKKIDQKEKQKLQTCIFITLVKWNLSPLRNHLVIVSRGFENFLTSKFAYASRKQLNLSEMNRTLSNFPMQMSISNFASTLTGVFNSNSMCLYGCKKLSRSIFKLFVEKAVKFSEEETKIFQNTQKTPLQIHWQSLFKSNLIETQVVTGSDCIKTWLFTGAFSQAFSLELSCFFHIYRYDFWKVKW